MAELRKHDTHPERYCTALTWVRLGGAERPVLPALAFRYLLIMLLCVAGLLAVLEFRLAGFGAEGRIASDDWQSENAAIERMDRQKLHLVSDADPRWRSAGMPWPERRHARRRILVVGDSFVWGDGNDNANEIWWRQLHRELRHRGYRDVEVIALGFFGASTQDQLAWLRDRHLLAETAPDIVIMGYVTNDPEVKNDHGESYVRQFGRDIPLPDWPVLDRTLGRVAPDLNAQLKQHLTTKWQSKQPNVFLYDDWEQRILEPPNFTAYRAVVDDLERFMASAGVPFFVVTLPNRPDRQHYEARYRPVRPLFDGVGLRFHDLIGAFVGEYPELGDPLTWGVNPANGHPGPVTTRFYARQVADILQRDYPQTLGPKSAPTASEQPLINDWMPPSIDVKSGGVGDWTFQYPADGELMPRLPIGRPHVLLSFAEPVTISDVTLEHPLIERAELFVQGVDPETGVASRQPVEVGSRSGAKAVWTFDGATPQPVDRLRLAVSFKPGGGGPAQPLHLRVATRSSGGLR